MGLQVPGPSCAGRAHIQVRTKSKIQGNEKKIIMSMGTGGLNKQFAKNHLGTKGRGESPRLKSREEGSEVNSGQQGKQGGRE